MSEWGVERPGLEGGHHRGFREAGEYHPSPATNLSSKRDWGGGAARPGEHHLVMTQAR